jgi:hypothetical protein
MSSENIQEQMHPPYRSAGVSACSEPLTTSNLTHCPDLQESQCIDASHLGAGVTALGHLERTL